MAVTQIFRRGDSQGQKPLLSRRVSTMLVCLLLASSAWLLHALSKQYTTVQRVQVVYMNLPADKLLSSNLPDSVDAELRGSGFTLLTWKLGRIPGVLELDVRLARRNVRGDLALLTNISNLRLRSSFGRGASVVRVHPDTIALSFSPRVSRKVPVRAVVSVSPAPQFQLADSISTDPAFVVISGSAEMVNRISYVTTEPRSYDAIDKNVEETVPLQLSGTARQLSVQPASVKLNVKVDKFTEARITIPVTAINVPPGTTLKTIPDKAELVFLVPLSEYGSISANQFRVVADYKNITPGRSTIPLTIVRRPLSVRNLRTEPERVEYIISLRE
ncbi:MAG: CdaR family protein [Bacteroidia bacterium]